MIITYIIIIGVLGGLGFLLFKGGVYFFSVYNELIKLKNDFEEAWANIDVQLKRRNDLIANITVIVNKYSNYENDTYEDVTKARQNNEGTTEITTVNGVPAIRAVSEQYPDLEANQNYILLQNELVATENVIGERREAYNKAVTIYNNKTEAFPESIVAKLVGFKTELYLVVEDKDKQIQKVVFIKDPERNIK